MEEMVKNTVLMRFASKHVRADEALSDVESAFRSAACNLSHHGIFLGAPEICPVPDTIIFVVYVPKQHEPNFLKNPGPRLSGIARALKSMNFRGKKYSDFFIGTRLVRYTIINHEDIAKITLRIIET